MSLNRPSVVAPSFRQARRLVQQRGITGSPPACRLQRVVQRPVRESGDPVCLSRSCFSQDGPDGRLLALVNPYGRLRHACPATVLTPSSAGALLTAHHRDVQFFNNCPSAPSLLKLQHSFNYRNNPDPPAITPTVSHRAVRMLLASYICRFLRVSRSSRRS